jgi:hypothetical protein
MTQFTKPDGGIVKLNKIYIQKYWDKIANPEAKGAYNDFPVMRYAEVLLIYAEANAQLSKFPQANTYVNMIRKRAGLPDVNLTSKNEFIEAVLLERRKEFVCEGMRWLIWSGQIQLQVKYR